MNMDKFLKYLGIIIISIYGLGTIYFGILFNYLYAINHGFVSWLFFGEIIATLKAIIWPYYVIVGY